MRSAVILKLVLKKRSTRACLRNAQVAIRRCWSDLFKELVHGRDLRNHCRGKTGILLHIGCGELVQPGWVNVDFEARPGVLYFNMLNPFPIEDGTVAQIHAEHFLEHLEYDDAVRFLSECHRVLKTQGRMRIVVPDVEKYMRAYVTNDEAFFERLNALGGASEPLPTKAAICNQMFRMGGDHRFAWDFETLEHVARQVGFSSIKKSHHNDSDVPNCIDAQDWWRPFESLYAVATR